MASLCNVHPNLPGQLIEVGVTLLVAELMQEFDRNPAAVDRFVEIEHEYLEQWLGALFDRRTDTEAGDARTGFGRAAVDPDRENARQRRLMAQHDVGGGKTQISAELVAVRDVAGDDARPAEQLLRVFDVSERERGPHGRARRTLAIDCNRGHRFDTESRGLLSQERQVAD